MVNLNIHPQPHQHMIGPNGFLPNGKDRKPGSIRVGEFLEDPIHELFRFFYFFI